MSESATQYNSVYKDPLHLTSADQSLLQIISQVFAGKSFLHWSRNIKVALITENKLGFIDGTYPQPAFTHANYNDWIRTDYTVMRWILHSLFDSISESLTYVTSSKVLWDELKERYNQSNAHFIYQLCKKMLQIVQGEDSVATYYARLRSIWEDIHSLDPLPDCTCGIVAKCTCSLLKKIVARYNNNNLIDFLIGFDKQHESLRGQILAMEPLPTVNQAFAKVHQAEIQRSITGHDSSVNLDGIALTVTQCGAGGSVGTGHIVNLPGSDNWRKDTKKPQFERPSYHCDFCNKLGHTREFCLKLKGSKIKTSAGHFDSRASPHFGKKFAGHVKEISAFKGDSPCALLTPSSVEHPVMDSTLFRLWQRCKNVGS
ncbi:hypothetical protein RND81_13G119500 [Saponaria officinalis]|uniref:Retrotransposon Copia-like N-terminal domain-containing protein n=1 Tax=Saponaria officinalis TaxID=3572 RepID=A0AAW1GZQ2_SAPOF